MSVIPLESNPEVMTKFMYRLGVESKWSLVDVYGLDPELLEIIPKPVVALIFLYPHTEKATTYTNELVEKIKKEGQELSPNLFHMEQCVSNTCGTIALIHAVSNNLDQIELKDGIAKTFLEESKDLSFEERGKLLVETANEILDAHEQLAQEGQTPAPEERSPVYYHFVAYVEKDGSLYEMDGRKPFPINCGPTTKDRLLQDAVKICREYMLRDPDEFGFTMIALVPTSD